MIRHMCILVTLMSLLCSCNFSSSQANDNSEKTTITEVSPITETFITSTYTNSSETIENMGVTTTFNDAGIIYENVYSKLEELSDDNDFIQLSKEEKKNFLIPILDEFMEKNYITEYNFNINRHPAIVDFKFSCGGLGCYELEEHYDNEN